MFMHFRATRVSTVSPDQTTPSDPELVDERQTWLLERVEAERRVTTTDAAVELGVSVDTVRRDLRLLNARGLLRRVHGGAVPVSRRPNSFAGRVDEESEETTRLAAAIVERFRPGQVIGLDGGSTCAAVAAMIPSSLAVTIVTNSPAAALALTQHPSAKAILLGGHLDLTWMTTTGAETVDGWRHHRLDLGVLGVCGLDADSVSTNSSNEVATKRAIIDAAADVVVPVHADKVGVQAPFVVADLAALDTLVAVEPLPDDIARRANGVPVSARRRP